MAREQAVPTATSGHTETPDNDTTRAAHFAAVPTVTSPPPGVLHGPRYGTSRGFPETQSYDESDDHKADASSPLLPSPRPPPSTRFMDLMRSAHPPLPTVTASIACTAPTTDATDAIDGSAEALLSLMESVRAKELKFARDDSLISTVGRSASSASSHAIPPIAVPRDHDGSSSGERAGDASSDGGHERGIPTHQHRPHKKRKSTHTVRKEEKAMLVDEIKALEDRLTFLRGQVFAPVRDGAGHIVNPGVSNAVLRQAIHEQQLRFASARSLLSQSLTSEIAAPLHTYLHLGSNMAERRAQLLAMKPATLASGKRYIEERSLLLDLAKHHAVVERFETVTGDACCIRFYVDQFPSTLTTVKNVHEATSFFTSNLEMSITECLGHITIREDDDSGDPSLAQHRLVVAGTHGVVVDTNNVVFSHYNEDENYGILTTTFVDQDDLHPYRPLERIRQDVTAVSLITQQNDIVVVRRWAYVCMRHSPHIVFPYGVLQTIRENLGIWGDGMMQFVRERLRMKAQASVLSDATPSCI